ncbi:MAG: hypothetical protein H7323_06260 [Frankiales bacterium]|nr:hypothetical protein [Frankiales bacterium]
MTHPCACCALRFTNSAELAEHIVSEHVQRTPFVEGRATVVRPRRFQASKTPHHTR